MGLFNIVGSLFLSKTFGTIGACFSIFLAYSLRAILYHIIHKKIMRLDIWEFIKKCYLQMLPSVIITLILGLLINSIFSNTNWMTLALKGAILLAVFILSTVVFCLTKKEKSVYLNFLKK